MIGGQLTIADVGAMPEVEFAGEIHPVADLFPMMTDDELNDLAEDILANGLIHPVVVDEEGRLVDGRNRLAACQRVGVVPQFVALNGHDPVAFIIGANVTRRHLSKGQQAMAVAKARRLCPKDTVREAAERIGTSYGYFNKATVVLEYAPELAGAVLVGATALLDAYDEARNRKLAAEGRESRLTLLQSEAPDLAALVQEERISLNEAIAALEKRQREEREYVLTVTKNLNTALTYLDPRQIDPDECARKWLKANPALIGDHADFSAISARRAADALLRYADLKEEQENG